MRIRLEATWSRGSTVEGSIDTRLCYIKQSESLDLPSKDGYSEEEYKYIKNGVIAYPELYFANLVILGEGDSEEILLPKMIEVLGNKIDTKSISVVPLGGRHVNHFWRLLNQLNIPYITLLDLDRERYLGGWGRIKYVCEELIKLNKITIDQLEKSSEITMIGNFDDMHIWNVENIDEMNKWIGFLEAYDIYFSAPLDIDFLMIKKFKSEYLQILNENEGPQIIGYGKIKDIETEKDKKNKKRLKSKYDKRLSQDVKDTLKDKCTSGSTFTKEEMELMIWYKYFFLTRGKPTTHRVALLNIEDEMLIENMPDIFMKIRRNIESKLC